MAVKVVRGGIRRPFRSDQSGLCALELPIALGGTSNHFRTKCLIDAGGWDEWNVTEDADLGIRLARFGYKVGSLNSDTSEEAPHELLNWFRQRVRWQKGWMQTGIVHAREPINFISSLGALRALSATALIAGSSAQRAPMAGVRPGHPDPRVGSGTRRVGLARGDGRLHLHPGAGRDLDVRRSGRCRLEIAAARPDGERPLPWRRSTTFSFRSRPGRRSFSSPLALTTGAKRPMERRCAARRPQKPSPQPTECFRAAGASGQGLDSFVHRSNSEGSFGIRGPSPFA